MRTPTFFARTLFSPSDPPNAAYEVRIVADYRGDHLTHIAPRQTDRTPPPQLGRADLFIDTAQDCAGCGDLCADDADCCPGMSCGGPDVGSWGADLAARAAVPCPILLTPRASPC